MKVASIYKLTFDPASTALVLLDYGDYLEEEIKWPLQRGVEVIPLVDSAAPFLRSTGNAFVTLNLARYQTVAAYSAIAADLAARETTLDKLISIAAATQKILRVQLQGFTDHYWEFAACVISGLETTRYLEAPVARVFSNVSLTCAGLSKKNGTP